MRQVLSQNAVHKSAEQRSGQGEKREPFPTTDLGENRSGAGSGHKPANAENRAAEKEAFGKRFFWNGNFFAENVFDPESLDQEKRKRAHDDGRPDDEIEIRFAEIKHVPDFEPGNHLAFVEHDAEINSEQQSEPELEWAGEMARFRRFERSLLFNFIQHGLH